MSETNGAVATKTRKPPVRRTLEERRTELQKSREFHVECIKSLDDRLAALNGAVSVEKALDITRKFLENLTTVQLKAHAQRVGIEGPEHYEDLDDLIHDCLVKAGLLEEPLSMEHGA